MSEQDYRRAERNLWSHAGLTPEEHRIRLPVSGVHVRVQEVGEGPPALFLHPGGPNAGATWALVAAGLPGVRCLLVDRPGAGLSERLVLDTAGLQSFGSRFVGELLDALEVERADLVAGSIGGWLGLRSAAAGPERIGRIVQLGWPPFMPGGRFPRFMRTTTLPGVWRLISRLPGGDRELRMLYRWLGHDATLDQHRIPEALWKWQLALWHHTDTERNEYAQLAAVRSLRSGADPELVPNRRLLRSIRTPVLLLVSPDDPFGDAESARRLTDELPNARLEIAPGIGHWPWLHDPDLAAGAIRRFLRVEEPDASARDPASVGVPRRRPIPRGANETMATVKDDRIHRAISPDGTEIAGRVHGHGPPLVLVHGGPEDGDFCWSSLVPRLADRFTCFVMNKRGYGLSAGSSDLSSDRLVEDVTAFVEGIGGPAGLVGESAGGPPVLGAAARSEAVAAVAVYEPAVFEVLGDEDAARFAEAIEAVGEHVAAGRLVEATQTFVRAVAASDEEVATVFESGFLEAAASNIALVPQEVGQQSHPGPTDASTLAEVSAPVLLLQGSKTSDFFRDGVRHVAEHVPRSRVREIPGAGHFGAEIEAEAVAIELLAFFESELEAA